MSDLEMNLSSDPTWFRPVPPVCIVWLSPSPQPRRVKLKGPRYQEPVRPRIYFLSAHTWAGGSACLQLYSSLSVCTCGPTVVLSSGLRLADLGHPKIYIPHWHRCCSHLWSPLDLKPVRFWAPINSWACRVCFFLFFYKNFWQEFIILGFDMHWWANCFQNMSGGREAD